MATTTPAGVRGSHAKHGGAGGAADGAPMTHRQIMEALSGLLLGMFVAILSSTIVTNALPEIIGDLGGGQSAYTWVVTAALLAMTATTPLWGKLADLYSKKALVQIALVIYVLGSAAAGSVAEPRHADRLPCGAGHRRRRSVRPRADRHGRDDLPARARPLLRLPRRDVRRRDRRRPAARRCHHRHLAGSAGAGASTSVCRSRSSR